jgi:uncharacterized ubiquitin-like protein YukD
MMGLMSFFADRERNAELRESKDEMFVGELVRAMARRGWPTISFNANSDYQRVGFKALDDKVLSSVYLTVDRLTGSGVIGAALIGSKAYLSVTCELKNYLADPDDLIAMYRTDMANLFKLAWQDVKINHEYNAIHGTTKQIIELDHYVGKGDPGIAALVALLDNEITRIRTKLAPFKKADAI